MGMSGRLVLVRHAETRAHHPQGDHERELTEAGVAAAVDLGRRLAGQDLAPDHVVVSTAARALATLAALWRGLLEEGGPGEARTWQDRRVYDGGPGGVLGAVHESPEDAATVCVVGHEPVMSTTTWDLADPQALPGTLRQQLASGFPTATAAVLEVDGAWSDLGPAGARLVALLRGRPG